MNPNNSSRSLGMAQASGPGYTLKSGNCHRCGSRAGQSWDLLIANDQPLAVREWLPAFAQWLNAPPPPQISVEDALKSNGADAVYYGAQMRGVSNAKAKRELDFQPRPLEWIAGTAVAHAS